MTTITMNDAHIIHLAESLAKEHFGAYGGGDPIKAFNDYDVIYVEDDFGEDFEGLLYYKDNLFGALVNTGHDHSRSIGRRRFTGAHEYAHYSIAAHREAIRSGTGMHKSISGFESRLPMEREADIFASHFLLPTKKLVKFCGKGSWGAKEILDVADSFQTSITCSALRCQAALAGNSTLIMWTPDKVRWQRMDRDWWFELPARTIRTVDKLLKGSATERALNGEDPGENRFLQAGTTRASWFPRIAPWSKINDILIEEAIPLGQYGVLTILRPCTDG